MSPTVIAAAEPVFARGLQDILANAGPETPETYTDIRELHERFLECAPEVAVLDWRLLNGPAALEDLRNAAPRCRIALCAREMPAVSPQDLARLGVAAILPFHTSPQELCDVVRSLSAATPRPASCAEAALADCSELEKRIIDLVAQGMSDDEIGAALGCPRRAISAAVACLVRRFEVRGRAELALYGMAARKR